MCKRDPFFIRLCAKRQTCLRGVPPPRPRETRLLTSVDVETRQHSFKQSRTTWFGSSTCKGEAEGSGRGRLSGARGLSPGRRRGEVGTEVGRMRQAGLAQRERGAPPSGQCGPGRVQAGPLPRGGRGAASSGQEGRRGHGPTAARAVGG